MNFDATKLIEELQKLLSGSKQEYLVASDKLIVNKATKVMILRRVNGGNHTVLIDTITLAEQGFFVHDFAVGATISDRSVLELTLLALSITSNEGE